MATSDLALATQLVRSHDNVHFEREEDLSNLESCRTT